MENKFLKKKQKKASKAKNGEEDFKLPKPETESFKADCKGLGIVIYGEPTYYQDNAIANMDIHLGTYVSKADILLHLQTYLKDQLTSIVFNIIVAHEHGDKLSKCHFQCAVSFMKRVNRTLSPTTFEINGLKMLVMFQRAKNIKALWNYCKKEGDYVELNDGGEEQEDVWFRLANEKTLTTTDVSSILASNEPKSLLMFGDKIQNNYTSYVADKPLPPFEWIFPQHILDYAAKTDLVEIDDMVYQHKLKRMYKWFVEECVPDKPRRQALFLASLTRGWGKTLLMKSLVPHDEYVIHCSGSLDAKLFKEKQKTARLVILDDVTYIGNDKEMWKKLVSGEAVQLNTKHENHPWPGGLPCIVLTNEPSTCSYWLKDKAFQTQCCFMNFERYLGPPGTFRPSYFETIDNNFDDDFMGKIRDWERNKTTPKMFLPK